MRKIVFRLPDRIGTAGSVPASIILLIVARDTPKKFAAVWTSKSFTRTTPVGRDAREALHLHMSRRPVRNKRVPCLGAQRDGIELFECGFVPQRIGPVRDRANR